MKHAATILIAIILVIAAVAAVYLSRSGNPKDNSVTQAVLAEDDLNICEIDSDCIYVPYQHCCTSFRAINKKHLEEYNKNQGWQGVDLESCVDIPCTSGVPFNEVDSGSSRCVRDYDGIAGNHRCI